MSITPSTSTSTPPSTSTSTPPSTSKPKTTHPQKIYHLITDVLKGFLMGVCDVIPGISGGTIAFITGIYERLLDALNAINAWTIREFLKGDRSVVWHRIDGWFLVRVLSGILLAILSVAHIIQHLLTTAPIAIWWFFWWLIALSSLMLIVWEYTTIRKSGKNFPRSLWVWMMIWGMLWWWVSLLPMMNAWSGLISYYIAGAIAICAMILPGISGSYILVILGKYSDVLGALTSTIDHLNQRITIPALHTLRSDTMSIIVVFILWTITGLLLFSKLLHWIKVRYHSILVMLMTWFMIGTLGKIRPRQTVVSTYVDRHGEVQTLQTALSLPTNTGDALLGGGMMLIGMALISMIWRLSRTK
jgi:putative membrane protein